MDEPPSMDTPGKAPQPSSGDHVELRAAEIAKRNGRFQVTDEDRKTAYEEMRNAGQPVPHDEPAPH